MENVERERLLSLINSMADGVIAIDDEGKVVLYNGAALDLMNVNTTLDGEQLADHLRLFDKKGQPVDAIQKARDAGVYFVSRDFLLDVGDDELINLYLSIAPVRAGYGQSKQQGFIIVMRDITKEKSLEEERDEFISVVSHELRTPVTIAEASVSNALLLGQQHETPKSVVDSLHAAHEQVVFLANMLNDLSTLARAERQVLDINLETFDPKELVQQLVDGHSAEIKEKNLKLVAEIDANTPHLTTSQLYLREILQNFITNAIKYTKAGVITVKVAPSEGGVRFGIIDSGIGISKSDQKRLFEKFFRSEDYRTRESSGTGLGLYVTQKLAQRLKAKISVASELNKGSNFSIVVPNLSGPAIANPEQPPKGSK